MIQLIDHTYVVLTYITILLLIVLISNVIFYFFRLGKIEFTNQHLEKAFTKKTLFNKIYSIIRIFSDKLVAFILIIFLFPSLLIISLIVKITSQGPIFYRSPNLTISNKKIYLFKFRTFNTNKHDHNARYSTNIDPRMTPVGLYLRRSLLSELPTIFNVLTGDLALIGYTPINLYENNSENIEMFKKYKKLYDENSLKPGLISLYKMLKIGKFPNDMVDLKEIFEIDSYYALNKSFILDLQIIFYTFISLAATGSVAKSFENKITGKSNSLNPNNELIKKS